MFKNSKKIIAGLLIVPLAMLGIVAAATPAYAACPATAATDATADLSLDGGANASCTDKQGSNITTVFKTVVNIMLFVVGAIAVIMLVIGGLRYVTSNGDQNAVTGAKNTILYAIIGIVVAFLAFAAVSFVTGQLEKSNGGGGGGAAATP